MHQGIKSHCTPMLYHRVDWSLGSMYVSVLFDQKSVEIVNLCTRCLCLHGLDVNVLHKLRATDVAFLCGQVLWKDSGWKPVGLSECAIFGMHCHAVRAAFYIVIPPK